MGQVFLVLLLFQIFDFKLQISIFRAKHWKYTKIVYLLQKDRILSRITYTCDAIFASECDVVPYNHQNNTIFEIERSSSVSDHYELRFVMFNNALIIWNKSLKNYWVFESNKKIMNFEFVEFFLDFKIQEYSTD